MTDVVDTHVPNAHDTAHVTSTGISNEKLAMWIFLGSECLLFGGLISTFLLYKDRTAGGPKLHELYEQLVPERDAAGAPAEAARRKPRRPRRS